MSPMSYLHHRWELILQVSVTTCLPLLQTGHISLFFPIPTKLRHTTLQLRGTPKTACRQERLGSHSPSAKNDRERQKGRNVI